MLVKKFSSLWPFPAFCCDDDNCINRKKIIHDQDRLLILEEID